MKDYETHNETIVINGKKFQFYASDAERELIYAMSGEILKEIDRYVLSDVKLKLEENDVSNKNK